MTTPGLSLPGTAPAPAVGRERRRPRVRAQASDGELTDALVAPLLHRPGWWWPAILVTGAGSAAFVALTVYSTAVGVGVWGNNIPVAWAGAIIDFLWWGGIGHAGTLLSAVLLLTRRDWRYSVSRVGETIGFFALVVGGIFPILHLGRQWLFYWLIPYPNTMNLSPQFKSALAWDVVAVTAGLIITFLIWYTGILPDLATVRDRVPGRTRRRLYGLFALGWNGSSRQWRVHHLTRSILAVIGIPLVITVYSLMALDLATAILPGWHSTSLPHFLVASAFATGLAVLLVTMILLRAGYGVEEMITERQLAGVSLLLLGLSLAVAYLYLMETFTAWYTGTEYWRYVYLVARPAGEDAWVFWAGLSGYVLLPQLFWSRRVRSSPRALLLIALPMIAAMWAERFSLVTSAQRRGFIPSAWSDYAPTWVDWGLLLGSVSLFAFLVLLAFGWVPFLPIAELKSIRHERPEEARHER